MNNNNEVLINLEKQVVKHVFVVANNKKRVFLCNVN